MDQHENESQDENQGEYQGEYQAVSKNKDEKQDESDEMTEAMLPPELCLFLRHFKQWAREEATTVSQRCVSIVERPP